MTEDLNLFSYTDSESNSENILVMGNPGAGKTEYISNFAVELIKKGTSPEDILCITFTNKASDEMRERIDGKLQAAGLIQDAFRINVSTFHAFAMDQLGRLLSRPRLASVNFIRSSILKSIRARKAFGYGDNYIRNELLPKIENAIRYVKSFNVEADSIDPAKLRKLILKGISEGGSKSLETEEILALGEHFLFFMKDYSEALKRSQLLDYNDLLADWLKLPSEKKRIYRWVLVDELQDLNEMEFEIALKAGENHVLVGDRKQSIFGFQGGSSYNFSRFIGSLRAKNEPLLNNHRSTEQILRYAKEFYRKNSIGPMPSELENLRSDKDKNGEVAVVHVADDPLSALMPILKTSPETGTTAIIVRRNRQVQEIAQYLDKAGVRYETTTPWNLNESSKGDIIRYLRSVISPGRDTIISALFTPYSETIISRAFSVSAKYKWKDIPIPALKEFAPSLHSDITSKRSVDGINTMMTDKILPIAASLGRDHFYAALSVQNAIAEYFAESTAPDLDELLDYISISEYEDEVPIGDEKLVLTTVHKAKGMEFDNVIYCPASSGDRTSYIDIIARAIILCAKDIDVNQELRDEESRIDFVAITRAKKSLELIVPKRNRSRYYIDKICQFSEHASTVDENTEEGRLSRAYQLFLHGHSDEALDLSSPKRDWVVNAINEFFNASIPLSFSMVEKISSPFEFLTSYIFSIREPTRGMTKGSYIHSSAEKLFKGEKVENIPEDYLLAFENLKLVNQEIMKETGMKQQSSELSLNVPVGTLFEGISEKYSKMPFKGKLDAVFESSDGKVLIVDYKTDAYQYDNAISDHRLQLYIYKKMYSAAYKLDLPRIQIAAAYVNLVGRVNTGEVKSWIDRTEPNKRKIDGFVKLLGKMFTYKDNPEVFIEDLLSEEDLGSNLQREIRGILGYKGS